MLFHGKIYETNGESVSSLYLDTNNSKDYAKFVVGNITIEIYGNYKVPRNFENIECIYPSMKTCKIELFENYIWKNYVLSLETGHRIDLENGSKIKISNENQVIYEKEIKY